MNGDAAKDVEPWLVRKDELTARSATAPELATRLRGLQSWQAARLARTYQDLRDNPRFAPAVDFFLSELYGPKDFSGRDGDVKRAWPLLKRSLPETTLAALSRAIELEAVTAELDHAMIAALAQSELNETTYATAYRAVGRRDARERQIELVIGAGESLQRAVRHRWAGPMLKAARAPAYAAGFGVLQDFLERGYDAFREMGDANILLSAVRVRETQILEALFSGCQYPFELPLASGEKRS